MRRRCRENRKGKKVGSMKSLMLTMVAALCCVALAEPAADAPRDGARRGGPGMRGGGPFVDPILRVFNPKIAEKLALTDELKAKLKEVTEAAKTAGRDGPTKMRDAMQREAELMKADKIDEAAVMKAIDEVFDLRREMAKAQAKRVIAVKSILTPEQIAKLREETAKMGESRRQRRGGPRGGKPAAAPEA